MAQGLAPPPHIIQINDITRLMPRAYSGKEDPKEHILKFKDYLDMHNLDPDRHLDWPEIIRRFKFSLEGKARQWYERAMPALNWDVLKQDFLTVFNHLGNTREQLITNWRNLKWDGLESVDNYLERTTSLGEALNIGAQEILEAFKFGFPNQVYAHIINSPNLDQAAALAKRLMAIEKRNKQAQVQVPVFQQEEVSTGISVNNKLLSEVVEKLYATVERLSEERGKAERYYHHGSKFDNRRRGSGHSKGRKISNEYSNRKMRYPDRKRSTQFQYSDEEEYNEEDLHQQRGTCYACDSPDHFVRDCELVRRARQLATHTDEGRVMKDCYVSSGYEGSDDQFSDEECLYTDTYFGIIDTEKSTEKPNTNASFYEELNHVTLFEDRSNSEFDNSSSGAKSGMEDKHEISDSVYVEGGYTGKIEQVLESDYFGKTATEYLTAEQCYDHDNLQVFEDLPFDLKKSKDVHVLEEDLPPRAKPRRKISMDHDKCSTENCFHLTDFFEDETENLLLDWEPRNKLLDLESF